MDNECINCVVLIHLNFPNSRCPREQLLPAESARYSIASIRLVHQSRDGGADLDADPVAFSERRRQELGI